MDLDEAVARLASLTLILDDTDIGHVVHDLARSAVTAVPSCVAVIITLTGSTRLAVLTPHYRTSMTRARSTMRLEFDAASRGSSDQHTHRLVFVADESAAFADFAAVARAGLSIGPDQPPRVTGHRLMRIGIDEDLTLDAETDWEPDGPYSMDSTINQAIGFLIDRGFEPGAALQELHARAITQRETVDAVAQRLLSDAGVTEL